MVFGVSSNISRRLFLLSTVGMLAACTIDSKKPADGDGDFAPSLPPAPPVLRPLPIPSVSTPSQGVHRLVAAVGSTQILPDINTTTWGFNGPFLGPTIRLSRGEDCVIECENRLPEDTAIHCHGMLLPAPMDGGPHSPIRPNETWRAEFRVEQPAATLWYHPHIHGRTGVQAYRGLAGMIIIDDDVEDTLDLPRDYGVDDIPVVIMDANFTSDGQLDENLDLTVGLQGEKVFVNGIVDPEFQATTRKVRFRLLNASTMRFHNIGFSDGRRFYSIASDTGLLGSPRKVDSVRLGPGERNEIVVEIQPKETVLLVSGGFPDNLGVPKGVMVPDFKLQETATLVTIRGTTHSPTSRHDDGASVPAVLDPSAAAPVDLSEARERSFELNTFEINGQAMDMHRIDFAIDHSDPEIWWVTNGNSDWIHNFHVHNCAFQVLESSPTDVEFDAYGWKDTVTIPPGVTVKLGVLFGQYRNRHYPYMYHCHMLYHEDQGMMGQFMMINKGESPELDTAYTQDPRNVRGLHGH
ncbi:Blue copper oxidase CueO precursor [Corynebacterium felinum]|nr:Blue copper oxidase CueO precursor [Corynebacterium felinum]